MIELLKENIACKGAKQNKLVILKLCEIINSKETWSLEANDNNNDASVMISAALN